MTRPVVTHTHGPGGPTSTQVEFFFQKFVYRQRPEAPVRETPETVVSSSRKRKKFFDCKLSPQCDSAITHRVLEPEQALRESHSFKKVEGSFDLASWGFNRPVETHQSPEALLPHAEVVPLVIQGRRIVKAVGRATASAVTSVLKKKRKKEGKVRAEDHLVCGALATSVTVT